MPLCRGTYVTATDVYKLSMAAYSAATALMTVQRGGRSMALHYLQNKGNGVINYLRLLLQLRGAHILNL